MSMGTVVIQIPFPSLSLVIEVTFLLLSGDGLMILCMKDFIRNGLDIRMQAQTIILGSKSKPLSMEIIFWYTAGNRKLYILPFTPRTN